VQEQKEGVTGFDRLLAGLDPASTALPAQVGIVAKMACEFGRATFRLADADSSASSAARSTISGARRSASVLSTSQVPAERVAAANSMGGLPVRIAVEALALASDPDRESDPVVTEAARAALEEVLQFSPWPSLAEWIRLHRRGYVSEVEIQARVGY
jgi:hypothetical protein